MQPELKPAIPPAIASLLERARQRFRAATMQNRNDAAGTMRDLLAHDGLDVNGRPLGQSDSGVPPVFTLGNRSIMRRVAEPESAAGSDEPFSLEFSYRGSNGQLTQRRVNVWVSDAEYFAGHCHLRNGHRLFSWDNVEGQVRLPDTGELADVDVIRGRFA